MPLLNYRAMDPLEAASVHAQIEGDKADHEAAIDEELDRRYGEFTRGQGNYLANEETIPSFTTSRVIDDLIERAWLEGDWEQLGVWIRDALFEFTQQDMENRRDDADEALKHGDW